MSDKKKEKSPFAGALADKLKDLDIEPAAREGAEGEQASEDLASEDWARKPEPAARQSGRRARPERSELDSLADPEDLVDPEDEALSDEELFAQAVEGLAPEDIYRGKFEGEGPSFPERDQPGSPQARGQTSASQTSANQKGAGQSAVEQQRPGAPEPSDEEAREQLSRAREARQFEKAVGPVDQRIERGKYRQPSMPDPAEDAARRAAYRSDSPDGLITPALPKSGDGLNNVGPLDSAQRDMLDRYKKRSRRDEAPEINVRGDTVDDALRQLELFVHQQWKADARFVRVIHGRGLRSDGDPVLKPAVLRWLEGPGYRYVRGYVPEVNSGGDYGSLVVELEKKE